MVYMLQNLLHYTGDYMSKEYSLLNTTTYPEQNMDFLNKLLFVPYRCEEELTVNYRLAISKKEFPLFEGEKGPIDNYTKVLRYDLGAPYKAILVDRTYNIIVADTRVLATYTIYPRYKYIEYHGIPEAHLPMTDNWDDFNNEYKSERLWLIHCQEKKVIGQKVYIEYFSELATKQHGDTLIEPSKPIGNYKARHNQDFRDKVYRAREQGYIIRTDESGPEAEMVAVVIDEENNTRKYILGSEAYFYIDTEDDTRKGLDELGLWQ